MTTLIRIAAAAVAARWRLAADRLFNRGRRTRWRCPRCRVSCRSPNVVGYHLFEHHQLPVDVAEAEMREARAFVLPRSGAVRRRWFGGRKGAVR